MSENELTVADEPSVLQRAWWRLRAMFRRRRPSALVTHAERELRLAGLFSEDSDYGGMMGDAVLAMIRQFSKEGHSGFSAGMAVSLFEKLARYQPLTPLTGEDWEWMQVDDDTWQNTRCSHVFKTTERGAYDIDGRVFREPDGACYTGSDSVVPVTFPYTPTREYVDVEAQ